MDWAEYAVSGFPRSWICDTWRVGLGGADHADADDGGGLGDGAGGVPRLPLAARREGPQRPSLSGSAALLRGPQHHLAGSARGIWTLECRLDGRFTNDKFCFFRHGQLSLSWRRAPFGP